MEMIENTSTYTRLLRGFEMPSVPFDLLRCLVVPSAFVVDFFRDFDRSVVVVVVATLRLLPLLLLLLLLEVVALLVDVDDGISTSSMSVFEFFS